MGLASSRASPARMAEAKLFVDGLIANHKVVVFSKTHCPYCTKAKSALNDQKLAPGALKCVEIEGNPDCDQIQDYLKELTGARSVPRVFINSKFIGGGDDTAAAAKSGKLSDLLKAAGALA